MTVGIATVCEASGESKVIVSADRMVTSGLIGRLEYEHTNSKMVPIIENESTVAMGVVAGSLSFADEFYYKIDSNIREKQRAENESLKTVRDVAEEGVNSFGEIVRESIERQTLKPYDFSLKDLKNQKSFHPQILQGIMSDANQKKEEVFNHLHVLLAGIDETGPHIYTIQNNDIANHDSIGYVSIGSGFQPAKTTFIKNRYDRECPIEEALFSVVEAKIQAERAQGVGRDLDIAVLSLPNDNGNRVHKLPQEEVEELREIQEEILKKQEKKREDIINKKDYTFEHDVN